jgi:hypothetical protein
MDDDNREYEELTTKERDDIEGDLIYNLQEDK